MASMKPVLEIDDIVPYFMNIVFDSQRLCEVVQAKLGESNSEEIAQYLVNDLGLSHGFKQAIISLLDGQIAEYKRLLDVYPSTEWAKNGSAVHVFYVECGLNTVVYSDRFEWDIFDRNADPDKFALQTRAELGLPGEFTNVISAQIRWQIIKLRAMHANPDRFMEYIRTNPIAAPQTERGLRGIDDLLDSSPAVGLIPGVIAKKATHSRDRTIRYLKRQGHAVSKNALQPVEETGVLSVKLVPIVRVTPMPEDCLNIDLAAVPELMSSPSILTDDIRRKVDNKFEQAKFFVNASRQSDYSDEDSDFDSS